MWNKCFHKVIQHLQVLIEGFDQPNQWQYEQHEKTMANSRRFPWFWIPITNGILWSWSWKILPKKTPRRGLTITRAINDLGGIILHFFSWRFPQMVVPQNHPSHGWPGDPQPPAGPLSTASVHHPEPSWDPCRRPLRRGNRLQPWRSARVLTPGIRYIVYMVFICIRVCMYVCTYVRMYVSTYVRMYVCAYVRMYVCTYVRMCVCTYVRM